MDGAPVVRRFAVLTGAVGLAMSAVASCRPQGPDFRAVGPNVEVTRLGAGVWAVIRREPLGLAVNANSLVIENDNDVVVVDAQFTREATAEIIAAIRAITWKSVCCVINTHWHDDHVAGNQVYRDTFPAVRFFAHPHTREDLVARGRPNRTGTLHGAPPLVDRYQRLLAMGLGIDSTPASEAEQASVSSALRIMRTYLAEAPAYREELPDVLVARETTLVRGSRRIEMHWFGRGNTRGDLVVHLPQERILATGDLVVAPVPFAFGSYPTEWIEALDSLLTLQPSVIVPGHGPILRDGHHVQTVRALLLAARDETRAAVARGQSLEEARQDVTLDSLRRALTGDDEWALSMFGRFFLGPVVGRLYEELTNGGLP